MLVGCPSADLDGGAATKNALSPYASEILDFFVASCMSVFATMRQLAIHGITQLLASGLLTDAQVGLSFPSSAALCVFYLRASSACHACVLAG